MLQIPIKTKAQSSVIALVALTLVAVLILIPAVSVKAGALNNTSVRFERIKDSTAVTQVRVLFTVPAGNSGTEEKVKVSFPDGYTVATASLSASTANCVTDTGATALPGTLSVAGNNTNGTKALTVSGATNLTASSTYCVDITHATAAVTNPTAGQYQLTVETLTSGSVQIDVAYIGTSVISNDQIVVTAIVPPSFTFTLSGNTDAFTTNLSTSSVVSTTGRTVTLVTNAPAGWIVWAKGLNNVSSKGSLRSVTAGNYNITGTSAAGAASHTLTTGTEDYGLGVTINTDSATAGTGVVTLDTAYDGSGSKAGTLDPTKFRPIATASGVTDTDVIALTERATISGLTPAANDYTDTLTIIGAGRF